MNTRDVVVGLQVALDERHHLYRECSELAAFTSGGDATLLLQYQTLRNHLDRACRRVSMWRSMLHACPPEELAIEQARIEGALSELRRVR